MSSTKIINFHQAIANQSRKWRCAFVSFNTDLFDRGIDSDSDISCVSYVLKNLVSSFFRNYSKKLESAFLNKNLVLNQASILQRIYNPRHRILLFNWSSRNLIRNVNWKIISICCSRKVVKKDILEIESAD